MGCPIEFKFINNTKTCPANIQRKYSIEATNELKNNSRSSLHSSIDLLKDNLLLAVVFLIFICLSIAFLICRRKGYSKRHFILFSTFLISFTLLIIFSVYILDNNSSIKIFLFKSIELILLSLIQIFNYLRNISRDCFYHTIDNKTIVGLLLLLIFL